MVSAYFEVDTIALKRRCQEGVLPGRMATGLVAQDGMLGRIRPKLNPKLLFDFIDILALNTVPVDKVGLSLSIVDHKISVVLME